MLVQSRKRVQASKPSKVSKLKVASKKPTVSRNKLSSLNKDMIYMGLGFPKKCRAFLKYVDTFELAGAAGALQTYKFRCNGMFDPDVTSTGHQPMYFDTYMGIYDHFTVISSKITFKFCAKATNLSSFRVATDVNDDTTQTAATIDAIAEQSSGKVVLVPAGSNNNYVLVNTWNARKWFGGDPLAADSLAGSASADPTEQSIYDLSIQATDATSTVQAIVNVEILYEAVFDEIKDLAQN